MKNERKKIVFYFCRFWEAVQSLRSASNKDVPLLVTAMYNEYLGPTAAFPVNVDSKIIETVRKNMENPTRWAFDEAAVNKSEFQINLKKTNTKFIF